MQNDPHQPNRDAEDYLVQNGYLQLPTNGIINDAAVFLKGNIAVVLVADSIEVKHPPLPMKDCKTSAVQILFNWELVHYYKSWDGKNTFQMMMLLDFMGAVKLRDVPKLLRKGIMATAVTEMYNLEETQVSVPQ